jgi:hypothetical protein
MTNDNHFEEKRWQELAERAFSREIPQHSEFLTLAERRACRSPRSLPPGYFSDGGYEGAERKVACFVEPEWFAGKSGRSSVWRLSASPALR